MRAAWVLFLIGCGFHAPAADNPGTGGDGGSDGGVVDLSPICPSIALGTPRFHASACASPMSALVHVTVSTSFNTDDGTSTVDGLSCARVANESSQVCILAASSIVIDPGVAVSAHGSLPFALFAHSMTLRGAVDVASHIGGATGAASLLSGCKPGKLASGAGGGRGGDAIDTGGQGGNDGSGSSGATGGGTFVFDDLTEGGCGGTRGGGSSGGGGTDGGITTGGAGGGVVWIVSQPGDLVVDSGAKINASGASGVGGSSQGSGGAGGGAGGLIVLQAPNIRLDRAAMIFANGGHGGGGAGINMGQQGFTGGTDGTDPTDPTSGGGGGTGGVDGSTFDGTSSGGDGGPGFPSTMRDGQNGTTDGHGGGGGGGSPGAIRVVSATDITGPNVSPPPILLQ